MNVQSSITFRRRELWLARMQANACLDRDALGPEMACKSTLDGECSPNCISGTVKDYEEAIALGAGFVAVPPPKRRSRQLAVVGQHADITISQLLQQACGSLHVSEEQRDSSCWQIILGTSWLRLPAYASLWLRWQQAQFAGAFAEQFAELLHIIGAWPSSAPFPARDVEIQGSP